MNARYKQQSKQLRQNTLNELMQNNFVELDSIADDLISGTLDATHTQLRVRELQRIIDQQDVILETALHSAKLTESDIEVRHLRFPWSFNCEYIRDAGNPWLIVGRSVEDMIDHAKNLRDLIETRRELWRKYQAALEASAE